MIGSACEAILGYDDWKLRGPADDGRDYTAADGNPCDYCEEPLTGDCVQVGRERMHAHCADSYQAASLWDRGEDL